MREKFLAVFDGTDECKSAVRYAARRAQLNNANLMIVATVDTAEFTYWLSINSKMINDIERESKEMLKDISKEILSYSCLLYTSPSPRDSDSSRMPSSA